MGITDFAQLVNEYGPSITIGGFAIWGIFKVINLLLDLVRSSDSKIQDANDKKDGTNQQMLEMLMRALEDRDVCKQKQHDEAAVYRKTLIRQCNSIAVEMGKETGANRVAIYDYCNGTNSLQGIPFLHYKTIAEKGDMGTRKNYQEKRDIGSLGVFLLDLERDKIITLKGTQKDKEQYPELMATMKDSKKSKGVFISIGTIEPLGFISLTFNHSSKVNFEEVILKALRFSQKLEKILDYPNIID